MTLTRAQVERTLDTIEATWPEHEIEFLTSLPDAELAFILEGVARLGLRPVAE